MMVEQVWALGTRRWIWLVFVGVSVVLVSAAAATGSLVNTLNACGGVIASMILVTTFLWPLLGDSAQEERHG